MNWTDDLSDPRSSKSKSLADELEAALTTASSNLSSSDSDLNVKVTKFSPGSVIVEFDIGVLPTNVSYIDKSELLKSLSALTSVELNNYEISPSSFSLDFVSDNCSTMTCSGGCQYNYTVLDFQCSCPEGSILVDSVRCKEHVEKVPDKTTDNEVANDKTIEMIRESIARINKTIQNIPPENSSNTAEITKEKSIKLDKTNTLNTSANNDGKKSISQETSTKPLNLVDLPESSRIKQKVIDDYFDSNFDQEVHISGKTIADASLYPSPTRSTNIINEKPEPEHLVLEAMLPKEKNISEATYVNNEVTELTESLDRRDYSKGLKPTTVVRDDHAGSHNDRDNHLESTTNRHDHLESTTENDKTTLHWVIQNSVKKKNENKTTIIAEHAKIETTNDSILTGRELTLSLKTLSTSEGSSATRQQESNSSNSISTTEKIKRTFSTQGNNAEVQAETNNNKIDSGMVKIISPNNGKFNSSIVVLEERGNVSDEVNTINKEDNTDATNNKDKIERFPTKQIKGFDEPGENVNKEDSVTSTEIISIINDGQKDDKPESNDVSEKENTLTSSIVNMLNSPEVKAHGENTSFSVQTNDSKLFTISIFLNKSLATPQTIFSQDDKITTISHQQGGDKDLDIKNQKVDINSHSEAETDSVNDNIANNTALDNPLLISHDFGNLTDIVDDQTDTSNSKINLITTAGYDIASNSVLPDDKKDEETSEPPLWTTQSLIGTSLKDLLNIRIQTTTGKPKIYQENEIKSETTRFQYTAATSSTITAVNTTAGFTEHDPLCGTGLVCGGHCLERHQVCDSLHDCPAGEDESHCSFPQCLEGEFQCLHGRCIPLSWECDGKDDCSSGEDEVACASSCSQGEILCKEGKCIPQIFLCNGVTDCGEGEDEVVCKIFPSN